VEEEKSLHDSGIPREEIYKFIKQENDLSMLYFEIDATKFANINKLFYLSMKAVLRKREKNVGKENMRYVKGHQAEQTIPRVLTQSIHCTKCTIETDYGTVSLENRGVSLQVLESILWKIRTKEIKRSPSVRSSGEHIRYDIVEPMTKTGDEIGVSYAELLLSRNDTKSQVGRCTAFVSYAWGRPFEELVESVRAWELEFGGRQKNYYFVDLFSINQHKSANAEDLSSLHKLVSCCQTFLLIATPYEAPMCLTRLWCIYEIVHAIEQKTDIWICLPPDQQELASKKGKWEVNSQKAKCGWEKDETMIRGLVMKKFGKNGFRHVDTIIQNEFRNALI